MYFERIDFFKLKIDISEIDATDNDKKILKFRN